MSKQAARRWFNVDEYCRMAQTGILREDDRVELIEGEVVRMSPIGSRHAACVGRLTEFFAAARDRVTVWVQNPIKLDDYSQPVPDIALLKKRDDFYAPSLPVPANVFLVIEVADSSLEYDRDTKMPLYGAAGIGEALLINLRDGQVEFYTNPVGDNYQSVRILKRGESFGIRALPNEVLRVTMLLGEAAS